eukprot:GEMP01048695.1.p1 GENE.GEMP01048695.1~~GEMP01048695.1.p1  ORF type:complete len:426 (+),score=94.61 GEMP01048695.1:404-1681(+)
MLDDSSPRRDSASLELSTDWDPAVDLSSPPLEFGESDRCTSLPALKTSTSLAAVVEIHSRLSVLGTGGFDSITRSFSNFDSGPPRTWKERWVHWCGMRDVLSIREQWVQVATAGLMGICALYSNCVAQVYLQQNIEGTGSDKAPLTDVGFKLLGYWHSPHAADIALGGFMALTALRFIILPGPYAMRWTILRRWLLCMGLLFLLRGMSIIATVLPNPAKECKSSVHAKGAGDENDWNIFVLALCVTLGQCVTCADVLYSGHTVNFTLAALIWHTYSSLCPYSHRPATCIDKLHLPRVFALSYALCGYIIIIKTRFHYSVDVWIGFWMTYFVWSYYHEAIKASPFHRHCLMRFLTWLEKHATDLKYWRIRVAKQFHSDRELIERGSRTFPAVSQIRSVFPAIVGAMDNSNNAHTGGTRVLDASDAV